MIYPIHSDLLQDSMYIEIKKKSKHNIYKLDNNMFLPSYRSPVVM